VPGCIGAGIGAGIPSVEPPHGRGVTALLALLASALWGGSDYLGGHLSKRLPALSVTLVGQACALAAVALLVPLAGGLHAAGGWLGWAVACGVIGPAALVAFYTALSIGTMGVVAPVAATGVVVPVLVGLVDGERPGDLQLAGIAAAVVGVVLASRAPASPVDGRPNDRRAVPLAVAAAFGFGGVLVCVAEGSRTSVGTTLLVQRLTNVALLGAVALLLARRGRGRGRPVLGLHRSDLPVVALTGLGDVSANGVYAIASTRGLVSVVAVLGSLYPVATALLARQLLGERLARPQAAGVATALAGVLLMAAG
jgi:drug/metabolite transporter (DMT)-like permease